MGKPIRRTMWIAAACAGLLIGCGEQTDSTTDTVSSTSAFETRVSSLSVNMKGKPAADANVEAVLVDVAQVNAVYEDGTVVTISDVLTTYDLVELGSGVAALIGQIDLPAGVLTEITLDIASASVTVDGVTSSLTVPSGTIRIKIDSVLIADGCSTEISLDFDAAASLKKRGKNGYLFTPSVSTSDFTTDCPEPPSEPDGGADAGTGDDGGTDTGGEVDAGPPEPTAFPLNVQYLWTDTTFMPQVTHMVGVPGSHDVAFALANAYNTTASRRATITDAGLIGVWTYTAESYFLDVNSGAYDPLSDRFAWGGLWPDGRYARVIGSTGSLDWSSVNYGSATGVDVAVTIFDDQGRLWTARHNPDVNAIQLMDLNGAPLAQLGTTIYDNPIYGHAVAVDDGSGDIIISSSTEMRRLHFDGTNINEIWSQAVSCDVDTATGGPLLVANGQLHHGTNSAVGKIQHRDLVDGSLIAETDYISVRRSVFNAVKDIVVDEFGDYWVLGSTTHHADTNWDLVRFDPDWNVRKNFTTESPTHPLVTAFTDFPQRPSSVFITSSGHVVLGGYANQASGQRFRVAAGKLVE